MIETMRFLLPALISHCLCLQGLQQVHCLPLRRKGKTVNYVYHWSKANNIKQLSNTADSLAISIFRGQGFCIISLILMELNQSALTEPLVWHGFYKDITGQGKREKKKKKVKFPPVCSRLYLLLPVEEKNTHFFPCSLCNIFVKRSEKIVTVT